MTNSRHEFSDEQIRAINHFTGPALVIAGPGSGKTKVIVSRLEYLITQKHIDPQNILVITFSKTAAINMQSRFNTLMGNDLPVHFGTFHSVFYNIIKKSNITKRNIATHNDQRRILKGTLCDIDGDLNTEPEYLDTLLMRIAYYKNSGLSEDKTDTADITHEQFIRIFSEYTDRMNAASFIDFEDMLLMCKTYLNENGGALMAYRKLFKFILIDEFQDINKIQLDIIRLLLDEDKNIFAVGDDDQAIYSFRGSRPDIMMNFSDIFKAAKIYRLSCNYRSDRAIVNAAARIIEANENRYRKNIYTDNPSGEDIVLKSFKNEEDETEYIIDRLKDAGSGNTAILYRTNNAAGLLYEKLCLERIPCKIRQKFTDPYDNEIFRDFLHYLDLAANIDHMDAHDLTAVMNKPVRYMSSRLIVKDHITFEELYEIHRDKAYMKKIIDKLARDIKMLKGMDMYCAFNYMRNVIGYNSYIYSAYGENAAKYLDMADNMQTMLKNFPGKEKMLEHVKEFERNNHVDDSFEISAEGIYIMTYHASKGLEFDNVFLPGLNEGKVPGVKSVTKEELEEERRMLYVAATRAKKRLYLTYTEENRKGMMSRFLYPLKKKTDRS